MPVPFLRRIDLEVTRNASSNSYVQVALPLAEVRLYRQGATVSSTVTIANNNSAAVPIYDLGRLVVGDTIQADLAAGPFTLTAINSRTQVALQNSSGASVTLRAGTRLVPTNNRPAAYMDARGTVAIGSTVEADATGRATFYIDESRFDYSLPPSPVTVNRTSSQTLTGQASSLTWGHEAAGARRVLLVAVSWQDALGEETITTVTYAGLGLTHIATNANVALYYLLDPPVGAANVVVNWSGTNAKGAIAAAITMNEVDLFAPLGSAFTGQGSSTAPSVQVSATASQGLVIDVVGVLSGATGTSLTVDSSQSQLWNATAGSGAATLTLGGGSTEPGNGASVAMNWTLGASKPWRTLAIEAKPLPRRLVIDAEGSALAHSPLVVNASDFPTLQAALDATPDGGTLYIPAGTWELATHGTNGTLVVTNLQSRTVGIRIAGDGQSTTLRSKDANTDAIVLDVSTQPSGFTMGPVVLEHFRVLGPSLPGPGRGVVVIGTPSPRTISRLQLENVSIGGVGSTGLYCEAVVLLSLARSHFRANQGHNVHLKSCAYPTLVNCYVQGAFDCGLFLETCTGGAAVGCAFEGNQSDQEGKSATFDTQVRLRTSHSFALIGCDFEDFQDAVTRTALLFENCLAASVCSCDFVQAVELEGSIGIRIYGEPGEPPNPDAYSKGILVGSNRFDNVAVAVRVEPTYCLDCVVMEQVINLGTGAIDTPTGSGADGIGLIELRRHGIRLPQYGFTSRPSSPDGVIIFVRDGGTGHAFQGRYGGIWQDLG